MNSLFTGVTGMMAAQRAVDVIANNVANLNTVAFKGQRTNFECSLMETLRDGSTTGINPMQVGTGVGVASIQVMMDQGAMKQTGRTLDCAINGDAFFVVSDGTTNAMRFTRDGVFELDRANRLVLASNGMAVRGWQADYGTGAINTATQAADAITVPLGIMNALPTTLAMLGGNLNAAVANGTTASTSFNVFDSLGTQHALTVTFTKTGPNAWGWSATCPDSAAPAGTGTVNFDALGHNTSTAALNLNLTAPNGATNPVNFTLDFTRVSQLDGVMDPQAIAQDGAAMGQLKSFSIDANGIIHGAYTNGINRVVGQIATARFPNAAGLRNEGDNLWTVSPNSGTPPPILQTAQHNAATIRSGYLEMSNVDLANEFAQLISMQRGYQANAKSITTSDEMLQDLLQLKR